MKYNFTVQFEAATEELAIFAFQNAVEKVAWADGAKLIEAEAWSVNPEADIRVNHVQTLRPEDFSNWTGTPKTNEEDANYAALIYRANATPTAQLNRILDHMSNALIKNGGR